MATSVTRHRTSSRSIRDCSSRQGDIPLCIIEGFGCYGECRNVDRRPNPGQRNFVRLDTLKVASERLKTGWIPLVDLLANDGLFSAVHGLAVRLAAYADKRLLTHYLMNDPSRLPGFRSYLAAIKGRRLPTTRLADAKSHLGDLAELESDLKLYRDRWLRARSFKEDHCPAWGQQRGQDNKGVRGQQRGHEPILTLREKWCRFSFHSAPWGGGRFPLDSVNGVTGTRLR